MSSLIKIHVLRSLPNQVFQTTVPTQILRLPGRFFQSSDSRPMQKRYITPCIYQLRYAFRKPLNTSPCIQRFFHAKLVYEHLLESCTFSIVQDYVMMAHRPQHRPHKYRESICNAQHLTIVPHPNNCGQITWKACVLYY